MQCGSTAGADGGISSKSTCRGCFYIDHYGIGICTTAWRLRYYGVGIVAGCGRCNSYITGDIIQSGIGSGRYGTRTTGICMCEVPYNVTVNIKSKGGKRGLITAGIIRYE